MVSGGITNDCLSKCKADTCVVCGLKVKANAVCVNSRVSWSMVDVM